MFTPFNQLQKILSFRLGGQMALLFAALALLAAACSPATTPAPEPTATALPAATATAPPISTPSIVMADPFYPMGTRTGEAAMDQVIEAMEAGDRAQLESLVHYTVTGCTLAEGLGGPPKCEAGQAEGTEVEVFPVLGSEGSYLTREMIDNAFPDEDYELFAAFSVPDDLAPEGDYWPVGDYGLLFIQPETGQAMTLLVTEEGIVRIVYGQDTQQLLGHREVSEFVLPPAGGA